MSISPIDILVFAPLAPILGVLLFWFIQLLFIESQKYLLSKIRHKHEPLCRFTNFTGILFQTICHALGYTVTRSGISHFYVNIHYGKVKPKKEKTGIFEWISNSFLFLGPFFIPAALLLICIFFLANGSFSVPTPKNEFFYIFSNQLIYFGAALHSFSIDFFSFLFSIDLLDPRHLGFLLLLIFLGMGIRPSYIGEEKKKKVDMIYDLKNIKSHVFSKPLYLVLLFLLAYVFFYTSLLVNMNWYLALFSVFGWLSIIAIVSLLIAHMIIILIKITDEIPRHWRLIPYLVLPLSYILMRVLFYFFPIDYLLTISLLIMVLSTCVVTFFLLKYKTNKFKTITKMKSLRVEDEPKRIIKK